MITNDCGVWLIKGNIIKNNSAGSGGGLEIGDTDTIHIIKNYVSNNYATAYNGNMGMGGGISVYPPLENCYMSENRFLSNRADHRGGAIAVLAFSNIYNNIIHNNRASNGYAIVTTTANNYQTECDLYFNYISNNVALDSLFVNDYGAIVAQSTSELSIYDCDIFDNAPIAAGLSPYDSLDCIMTVVDNYWGHPTGPYHAVQNPDGLGDTVSTLLDVIPYSQQPFTNFQPPTAPVLTSPADGATNDTLPVLFTWEAATDPNPDDTVQYILELSLDEDFTEPDAYYFIPRPRRVVSWFDYENTYYWRVIACDDVWLMDTSDVREVYVTSEGLTPRPFDLLAPIPDEIVPELPITFSWERAWDFTRGDTVSYTLQLAPVDQFDDPVNYFAGTDTLFTVEEDQFEWDRSYRWRVVARDLAGHETVSTQTFDFFLTGVPESTFTGIPATWELGAAYPNPFNARMVVVLGVPERGDVEVTVYDVLGRRVKELHRGALEAGWHRVTWQADAPSGVYFLRAQAKGWTRVRKMTLLK